MYYKLKKPYAFRGWKKRPFALRAEYGSHSYDKPFFFRKKDFLDFLYCNGVEEVDENELSETSKQMFKEMEEHNIIEKSDKPFEPLESWQRYHFFPTRFVEGVHWSITGKCNFKCRHCIVSAPDSHHPQLPLSDCMHIIDEIAECGIKWVDVTGGEPLLRADYEEIFKALAERGIFIRMFFTNASLLDEKALDTLKKYGHHPNFQLSFDGLGYHDWLRGVEGAEKQADAAFRLLQKHKLPVVAAMMIHRKNKDCLMDTAKYLADLGVTSLRVNAPQKLGVWKEYSKEYALSEDEVWEVYKNFIEEYFKERPDIGTDLDGYISVKKGETKYKIPCESRLSKDDDMTKVPYCESLSHHVHIRPDGRVAPCMGFSDTALGDKFPNVLEEKLSDILLESNYQDVVDTKLSQLWDANPECKECEHLGKCSGGCMVSDISDDGNFLIPDQRNCYIHKHIGIENIRKAIDEAIEKAGLEPGIEKEEKVPNFSEKE